MTAAILDIQHLLHPGWCDRTHEVAETDGDDVWATHSAVVEVEIGDTGRCMVVWIDAINDDAPGFALGYDGVDADGDERRFEGLPGGGMLDQAEAVALQEVLASALQLTGVAVTL